MRVDSRQGIRGTLYIDAGDGKMVKVPKPIWYDDVRLEVGAFVIDQSGNILDRDGRVYQRKPGQKPWRTMIKVKRLHFEPDKTRTIAAPQAAGLVAAGQQLPVPARRVLYDPRKRCQHYACDQPAEWAVAVERKEDPILGFEVATLKDIEYYCSRHYEAARIEDKKGEVIEYHDEVSARPN